MREKIVISMRDFGGGHAVLLEMMSRGSKEKISFKGEKLDIKTKQ